MSALCQKRTHAAQQKRSLFDHFVGDLLEMYRHIKAQRLGGLDVDDELILAFREMHVGALVIGTDAFFNNRFGATSPVIWVMPVTLPPGRPKLVTSPSWTGSPPVVKTIGIVVVAAFATRLAGVLVAAMTETRRRTRSSANAVRRSYWPFAHRYSMATFWPST
jgi:hypothetical protein